MRHIVEAGRNVRANAPGVVFLGAQIFVVGESCQKVRIGFFRAHVQNVASGLRERLHKACGGGDHFPGGQRYVAPIREDAARHYLVEADLPAFGPLGLIEPFGGLRPNDRGRNDLFLGCALAHDRHEVSVPVALMIFDVKIILGKDVVPGSGVRFRDNDERKVFLRGHAFKVFDSLCVAVFQIAHFNKRGEAEERESENQDENAVADVSQYFFVFQRFQVFQHGGRKFQIAGPGQAPDREPESQIAFGEKVGEMEVRQKEEGDDYAKGEEKFFFKLLTARQPCRCGKPKAHPQEDQAAALNGEGVLPEEELEPLGSDPNLSGKPGLSGRKNEAGLFQKGIPKQEASRKEGKKKRCSESEKLCVFRLRLAAKAPKYEVQ